MCIRCEMTKVRMLLHTYEWTPPAKLEASPTLYFNVAQIRLQLHLMVQEPTIEIFEFPYEDALISLITNHEIHYDHIFHIPEDKIRPSLVGNIYLKNRHTGENEVCSLMLDGHHSALNCVVRGKPVQLEVVPPEILQGLIYNSMEDLMNSPMMVLEA